MVLLVACGGGAPPDSEVAASATTPVPAELQVREGKWFSVSPEEEAYLDGRQIHHQAHERPRHDGDIVADVPQLPNSEEPLFVVVQAVISDRGNVARARLLEARNLPEIPTEGVEQYVADALATVELTPARVQDEAVSVYYNLTVVLR
jgi:hypothetical protein